MTIKTSVDIASGRIEMLRHELADVELERGRTDAWKNQRRRELRDEHMEVIVDELRNARALAIKQVDAAKTELASARLSAGRPVDVHAFNFSLNRWRSELLNAESTTGTSPVETARQLRDLVQRAGLHDEKLALNAAIAELMPDWTRNEALRSEAVGLKQDIAADAVSPEIQAAIEARDAAEGQLTEVKMAARSASRQVDEDDFRNSIAAGERSRLEKLVAGEVTDPFDGTVVRFDGEPLETQVAGATTNADE